MSMNKPSPRPRKPRTTDTRAPDVRFSEKINTELLQWERRFQNVRAIAYGRLAKGATDEQIADATQYLETEMQAVLTALRSIPERRHLQAAEPDSPRAPFQAVRGAPAKTYTPPPPAAPAKAPAKA